MLGWLAGWLAGLLGWLVVAGWLAGWLAGCRLGLLVGWLAAWLAGACLFITMPQFLTSFHRNRTYFRALRLRRIEMTKKSDIAKKAQHLGQDSGCAAAARRRRYAAMVRISLFHFQKICVNSVSMW